MPTKIKALLLALVLLVLLSACQPEQPTSLLEEQPAPEQTDLAEKRNEPEVFTLAFYPKGGTNPYLENNLLLHQLQGLLYSRLVTISPEWGLTMEVAQGVEIQGTTVRIGVKEGLQFADGTPLDGKAVLASLQAAMKSEYYGGRFANIKKIELKNESVTVYLKQEDALFAYLLDIPVLKAEDLENSTPVASGRYSFNGEGLVRNEFPPQQGAGPEEIKLYPVSSLESELQAFKTGQVSLLASENATDLAGAYSPRVVGYNTNNLVFLGINASRKAQKTAQPLLASPQGRQLLGELIDRQEILNQSFSGTGTPAVGPLNPLYGLATPPPPSPGTRAEGEALLNSLGYQKETPESPFTGPKGEELTLRLLYLENSDGKRMTAQLIARQLGDFGLKVTLQPAANFEEYTEKIAAGDFELYIGEVKLYNNMDLSLFFDGGTASAFFAQPKSLLQSWKEFRQDATTADGFELEFSEQMPFVPLVWRQGRLFTAKNIQGLVPSGSTIFYDVSALQLQAE